jgi:F0F1-type ATP synthase membrane subunit b/b'
VLLAIVLGAVLPAHGAEAEGGEVVQPHTLLFKWINLATLAAAGLLAIWRFGRPWFRRNAETISSAIAQASKARQDSERKLADIEARLGRLEAEVTSLRAEVQKESEAERERIHALAQSEIEKVFKAAAAEMEAASKAAQADLRAYAARLAVAEAELRIRREMDARTDAALLHRVIGELYPPAEPIGLRRL